MSNLVINLRGIIKSADSEVKHRFQRAGRANSVASTVPFAENARWKRDVPKISEQGNPK
ncbi:MAG TPA: hypothetical protein VGB07_31125 [Blastocatellia bacterium]